MDCHGCSINDVCKIADAVKAASVHATVTVTDCRIKASLGGITLPETPPVVVPPIKPVKKYRDFRQESSAAEKPVKDHEQAVAKVKIIPEAEQPVKPDLVNCPSCEGRTFKEDIGVCESEDCNNTVCSGCSTYNNGKRLCDECWKRA